MPVNGSQRSAHRLAFTAGLLVAGLTAPTTARADAVDAADVHLHAGRYKQGYEVLNAAHAKTRGESKQHARVLLALAAFYERHAGDFDEADRYLGEVLQLGLPAKDPAALAARQNQDRLKRQAARFKKQNEALFQLSLERFEPEVARQRVKRLRAFIARNPGYPRLASAHYYLGKNLLLLERYREAYAAFVAALKLRPALGYHLPVDHSKEQVHTRLVRQDLLLGARVTLGVLGVPYLLLFLWSRPWRTLGLRHGLLLAGLLACWWLFFRVAVGIAGDTVTEQAGIFPRPIYLHTAPGAPLSGVLETLFRYSLVGVAGVFVMAVSTARFARRWTWAGVNAVAGALLVASLMALFYLDHASLGAFKAAGRGGLPRMRGDFYYAKQDQDPFLLTDPLAYCKFQKTINEMDEDQIKDWFRRFARACKQRGGRP